MEFIDPQPLKENPMLSKVKIKIAYPGYNRNGSYISKETLEEAASRSLGLVPIVGYFNNLTEDFGEHGVQPVFDKDGSIVDIATTESLGVVPENPTIYWEGEYLVTEGYLWTGRYPHIVKATEGRPQSMEFSPEHTSIQKREGEDVIEIVDATFSALCILGENVTPAFEEASVKGITQYSKVDDDATGLAVNLVVREKQEAEKLEEGMDKFMEDLKFALAQEREVRDERDMLDETEDAKFIVDEEGVEKNLEVREKITEAIDTLDEVADKEAGENQDVIDDSITTLVEAETELAGEAKIVPKNTDVEEELYGEPSQEDGVVSTEISSYKSVSMLKKNKSKEEREEEDRKEEIEDKNDQSPEATPETEEREVPEIPSEEKEVGENGEITKGPEQTEDPIAAGAIEDIGSEAGVQTEPKTNPFVEPKTAPVGEGAEGEGTVEAEPELVAPKRKTAEDKRKEAVLDSISDKELSEHLIKRVEEAEEIKETIANLAGTDKENIDLERVEEESEEMEDNQNLEPVVEEEVETTEEEEKEVVIEDPVTEDEVGEKESTEEDEVEDDKDESEEDSEDPEPEKEEEVKEEIKVEKEKKKKKNFSLEFKHIVEENVRLEKKLAELEEEISSLREFKLEAEKAEKEVLLSEFAISDEAKEKIRSNFENFSLEDIEKEAALAFYRESRTVSPVVGQKEKDETVEFSLHNEAEKISTLQAILERASKLD